MKICEWVPNFSEGRNAETIGRLRESASSVPGAVLLHTDSNEDANRTVMTIAGTPDALLECAFRTCKTAAELIDMRSQSGEHPRSGSIDVSPFIPLQDMSVEESLALCCDLGTMVWQALGIPVYFYADAARSPERIRLPNIRKGGYEALQHKLEDPGFKPDIGDPVFNKKNGIMVCGVRNIMVAWNISINSKDTALAENIAAEIRESGRRGKPGLFLGVQAKGWYMELYGCAQISCNLHNPWDSALADIFSAAAKIARSAEISICGTKIFFSENF